jgi:hypothetical protein
MPSKLTRESPRAKPAAAMQGIRDMLRGSLAHSLRALSDADRLASAWPVACGSAMAGHGEVVAFEQGILSIQVTDATWLSQMISMRTHLQNELARIAAVPVTEIHFQLKR